MDMQKTKMKFKKEKLNELRLLAGKTMDEIASELGVNKSSISNWESKYNEGRPSPRNLRKLARLFKVSIGTFFFLLILLLPAHAAVDSDTAIRAIVGEAANQGPNGMTAVGEVIRNRGGVKGLYGYKAMKARTEPSWVWKQATEAWERSKTTHLTKGATLFENINAFGFPKSWDRTKVVCVAQIKDHWFFTER